MFGSVSGGPSRQAPVTTCWLQAAAITLRNDEPVTVFPSSGSERSLREVGQDTTVRTIGSLSSDKTRNIRLAASTNGVASTDSGSIYAAESNLNTPDWKEVGTFLQEGPSNLLGMAYKESLITYAGATLTFFQIPAVEQDSIIWSEDYTSNIGTLSVVGSVKTQSEEASSLTLTLPTGTIASDWVVFTVAHDQPIELDTSGWTTDFTGSIRGTNPETPLGSKLRAITVFRKQITASDVTKGDVVISLKG